MTKQLLNVRSRPTDKALRIHGTIARTLGVAIMSGKYKPGDLLVGEIASSERLAVSRTAYREAVRILSAKGLVESRPKVGTKITPRSKWQLLDPDVLAWAFENEPDLELLESLFELRNIVESAAAGIAATRRTYDDLDSMRGKRNRCVSRGAGRPCQGRHFVRFEPARACVVAVASSAAFERWQ